MKSKKVWALNPLTEEFEVGKLKNGLITFRGGNTCVAASTEFKHL